MGPAALGNLRDRVVEKAPPAGLEPATKSLEVTRSIQLSYGGWARQGYLPHGETIPVGRAEECGQR